MRLFSVPQLAQRKVFETQIHAMILLYVKQRAGERQWQEDVSRHQSTEQSESGGLRDGNTTVAPEAPLDSVNFRDTSRQEAAELPGNCPFDRETEEKLSEDQIVLLLTHDWRQTPSDEAGAGERRGKAGGREKGAATVTVPGLEAWSEPQLRTCTRAQLLALLREAARRLTASGVLAVPAVAWDLESTEAERQAGRRVGFLLLTYRPEYWYWELVELARKFFTACATTFAWQRNARQLSLVLGVTIIALLATMVLEPYRSRSVLNTQIFSLSVQGATLLYGLTKRAIEATEDIAAADEGQAAYAVLLFLFLVMPVFPLLLAMAKRIRDDWMRRALALSPTDQASPPASRKSPAQTEGEPASPPSDAVPVQQPSREGVSCALMVGPEPVELHALGSARRFLSQPGETALWWQAGSDSLSMVELRTGLQRERGEALRPAEALRLSTMALLHYPNMAVAQPLLAQQMQQQQQQQQQQMQQGGSAGGSTAGQTEAYSQMPGGYSE
eukprot:2087741-Rhodomonas_salina.2